MNLHPIIVHFPIACLVLYALLEFVSLRPQWKTQFSTTKLFLLIVGMLGTFIALQTGEIAQDLIGTSDLVEVHERFANISYILFGILLVFYVLSFLPNLSFFTKKLPTRYARVSALISWIFTHHLHLILVTLGMIALTITGALWGAISHGPDTDFVVRFFYDLLVGK